MKRGLVFALCAIGLVSTASLTQADGSVSLSLNLRYTDPAAPAEGGRFFLMAKTTDADDASGNGIAGISAYLTGINTAGIVFGNPTAAGDPSQNTQYPVVGPTTTGANVTTVGGTPYNTTFTGGVINVVYGQDLAAGPLTMGVGKGAGTPGNIPNDPLQNAAWNNAALIMSGTFGASRPAVAFNVGTQNNNTDANTFDGNALGTNAEPATNYVANQGISFVVRGDSVSLDNLEPGDANRDGTVDGDDFNLLAANYGTGSTWDQGDFNNSGTVDGDDFNALAANYGDTRTPPIVAIPEPASVALLAMATCGLCVMRRRMK